MGRKTFESIGRVLPGRLNIVISRASRQSETPNLVYALSLEEALELGRENARAIGRQEAFVIGGGEIYRQALPLADRLYLTEVDCEIEGDATFPEYAKSEFKEVSREERGSENGEPPFRFLVLERT
jgi:dihydrofolate reductase